MPIYEYECQGKCKKRFEYMQSMSEPAKKKCEKCGGKLEKLISAAGFVLKGGGWYKDLYATPKGDGGGGGDGDSGAASGSASADGAKAETAAKSDKADKPAKAEKAEKKAGGDKKAKKQSSKGR